MKKTLLTLLSITAVLVIAIVLSLSIVPSFQQQEVSAIEDAPAPINEADPLLASQEAAFAEIYDSLAPSVVAITIYARENASSDWTPVSGGSGFVVDSQGHIVTNYHVVYPASHIEDIIDEGAEAQIEVRFFDGTIVEAEIVAFDDTADISVIRVELSPDRLHPVAWGDSEAMYEGQLVFALGNPYSNDWTLTSGIVSATNRSLSGLVNYSIGGVIQTDAAINPGNSGGPLVNLRGEVVGVNSRIVSESGSNSGIGFAVPSNLVIRVADALITTGRMEYSYMGISQRPIDLNLIQEYNLPNNLRGVAISRVLPDTPAEAAGLRSQRGSSLDVVTAINGEPLEDFDDLIAYLNIHSSPGDVVRLTVYRAGEILEVDLTLVARPE